MLSVRNSRVALGAILIVGVGASAALLLGAGAADPPVQLFVTGASVNLDAMPPELVVEGVKFGNNPEVFVGIPGGEVIELVVLAGDDDMILAQLPFDVPGTYSLRVSRGPAQTQNYTTTFTIEDRIGVTPVGSIIAWHKSLAGTPALPVGWVECNGQLLDDPDSPYDGVVLPDLNGQARFLRGGGVSGTLQSSAMAAHVHNTGTLAVADAGEHSHSASLQISSMDLGSHGHGGSVVIDSSGIHGHGSGGIHNHEIKLEDAPGGGAPVIGNHLVRDDPGGLADTDPDIRGATFGADSHVHSGTGVHDHGASLSVSDKSLGAHDHGGSVSLDPSGNHGHAITGSSGSSGSDETRPDNMSVVWILRVK